MNQPSFGTPNLPYLPKIQKEKNTATKKLVIFLIAGFFAIGLFVAGVFVLIFTILGNAANADEYALSGDYIPSIKYVVGKKTFHQYLQKKIQIGS